jgi:hypothetical protein
MVMSVASLAYATPTTRLVYSRTADAGSCPDEKTLRQSVAARVGYDPFFAWAKRTVVASLARRGKEFIAKVDLIDEDGVDHGAREIRTEGPCSDLLDTVALAIAIAIDPQSLAAPASKVPPAAEASPPSEAATAPPPPQPPPSPSPPPPPQVPRTSEPGPSTATREKLRPDPSHDGTPAVDAFLGVAVSRGVAPATAYGLGLGAALRWRWLSLGLDLRVDAPVGEATPGGGSVSSWLAVGTLAPCAHLGPALACALVQGGSLQSHGDGVADGRGGSAMWFAMGMRIGAGIQVRPDVELRARAEVVFDLDPATLLLDSTPVWTAPLLAGSFAVDGVVHFR